MKPARTRMSRTRGYTLVELLITMVVMVVLLAVVAPSFQSAFLSNRLASYANTWAASAQLARSEAIKRNLPVLLCRSDDNASCTTTGTWQAGWIVCVDANSDGTCSAGESKLQKQSALSGDYHFTPNCIGGGCTGTGYTLSFQPSGVNTAFAQWKLVLCRATPSAGNQEREIYLRPAGNTYVKQTKNGTCA